MILWTLIGFAAGTLFGFSLCAFLSASRDSHPEKEDS